jgi:hypothetical protein
MPKKLTAPQQIVINALIENEGSYLHISRRLYSWGTIVSGDDKILMLCIYTVSIDSLINKKLLVEFEKDKYKLNPDFKQVIKN